MPTKHPQPSVYAVACSPKKGRKMVASSITLKTDFGVVGDFHAGSARQVSLLALESINRMRQSGLCISDGDFGENIIVSGLNTSLLKFGSRLLIGKNVCLEVTQIGKPCTIPCAIHKAVGDCIMPREGLFFKVINGGTIVPNDNIFHLAS